jgi:regulator of ribonuclease activity A
MELNVAWMPTLVLHVWCARVCLSQGIVVNGLIRDSQAISGMALGVKALGTLPLKSDKAASDQGQEGVVVEALGVPVSEGDWVYADWDGVVVSKKELS